MTLAASSSAAEDATVLNLEAPSIINGCQTVMIANEYLKRLEKAKDADAIEHFREIKVIAKVVVGTTNDQLKEITNSNNRQNPIENWQLFSNEPVHIEIEAALKDRGVFYERQKGKFDSVMKSTDNARYYSATNGTYIKVVDLAQVVALSRGHLQWAAKPSEIFLNKDNHDKIFDTSIAGYPNDAVFITNAFKALKRGLNKYLELPTHANSNAPVIFKKPIIRSHVYYLGILDFYQSDRRRSARTDFSTSLTKIANSRLVDDAQAFYQKLVTKVKNWYTEESRNLTIDISTRKMDAFFIVLAAEIGVDAEGPAPFTPRALDWAEI